MKRPQRPLRPQIIAPPPMDFHDLSLVLVNVTLKYEPSLYIHDTWKKAKLSDFKSLFKYLVNQRLMTPAVFVKKGKVVRFQVTIQVSRQPAINDASSIRAPADDSDKDKQEAVMQTVRQLTETLLSEQ